MIRQLSIFIENKEGRLSEILKVFKDYEIDIRSLTIVETSEYGIIRLILSETDQAIEKLKNHNIMVTETKVMAIGIEDTFGELYEFVQALAKEKINIEYAYQFITKKKQAVIIFKVKEKDSLLTREIIEKQKIGKLYNHIELLTI